MYLYLHSVKLRLKFEDFRDKERQNMGLRNNLSLFMSWANEGFDKSLLLAKIFSSVHIVHTYFFMLALVTF